MDLTDFSKGSLWAIHPKSLTKMLDTLPNLKDLGKEAINFTPEPKERDDFLLRDGVAIIPVTGVLSKRMTFWSWLFGGSSYIALAEIYNSALNDPDVEGILLDMDTPGGTVNGVEAFGNLVYASREVKPVAAFGNGMITSAGYWIASATKKIIVEQTTDVGSIGILMVHQDWSKFDDKMGIKRTVLSSGKYKALGNDSQPLSDLARETFQQELDYLYTQFVDVVARNRGVDSQAVIDNMADGRVFIGQQAVDAGLVDATGSIDTAIEAVLNLIPAPDNTYYFYQSKEKEGVKMDPKKIEVPKTVEELAAAFPEMTQALIQQGVDSVDTDKAVPGAVEAEKTRIIGLASVQFGDEVGEAFKKVVETGVTVDQFTAIKAAQPKQAAGGDDLKAKILEALHASETPEVGLDVHVSGDSKPFMAQVDEYVSIHKCTKTVAMQAVMKKDPKAHKDYINSVN